MSNRVIRAMLRAERQRAQAVFDALKTQRAVKLIESMQRQITIHCSALPRALGRQGCAASLQVPGIDIQSESNDANLGIAAHLSLKHHVLGNEVDLAQIATMYGIEESALAPLFHSGRKCFEPYRDALEIIGVEFPVKREVLAEVTLVGTADLLAWTKAEPRVLVNADWKSSESRDPLDQQIGYGVCHLDSVITPFKIISFYLREGIADVRDVTTEMISDWMRRLAYALAHPDRFKPSPSNCQWCRRKTDCPARTQLMRASLAAMADPGQDIKAMTPAQCGDTYLKLQAAERYCEEVRNALREKATDGSFVLPDGREVALVDDKKERIDVDAAWEIMRRYLGCKDNEELLKVIGPFLNIGKGALTKKLSDMTAKGKGKLIEAFLSELRGAGALIETCGKKFSIRKAIKEG
jgi:hypothetical protein